ncbi:MAG: HD domain-containing phosphohydrolase [Nitrospirota bacterium]
MSDQKPILRYSELAQTMMPAGGGAPDGGSGKSADIAFREIEGLKAAKSGPATPRAPVMVPDNRAGELFRQATREARIVYEGVRQGQPLRIEPLFGLAESIVAHPSEDHLIRHMFDDQRRAPTVHRNAATCAIIAARIGRGLGYPKDDLVQLTVAGLLHDIGVEKLPTNLLEKPGKLTSEEFAMVQTHPEWGYRLLHQHAPKYPIVAQIVRQEHEREAGQGYPDKLTGEAILEPAKIIGVTDIYDALITPRPYRKAFCPHEAIQELLDCQERMGYARHVVRALIQQFSLFPPGCWVELSSHEIARVIQSNSRSPLRPVVEVLYAADHQPLVPPRVIDLDENPLMHITASLCTDEIPASKPAHGG